MPRPAECHAITFFRPFAVLTVAVLVAFASFMEVMDTTIANVVT